MRHFCCPYTPQVTTLDGARRVFVASFLLPFPPYEKELEHPPPRLRRHCGRPHAGQKHLRHRRVHREHPGRSVPRATDAQPGLRCAFPVNPTPELLLRQTARAAPARSLVHRAVAEEGVCAISPITCTSHFACKDREMTFSSLLLSIPSRRMKKTWNTPTVLALGTVADLTHGKTATGTDSMFGGQPTTGEFCIGDTASRDCSVDSL